MPPILLMHQLAAGVPDDPPRLRPPIGLGSPCPTGAIGDVVVCGRSGESRYRLPKLGDPPGAKPLPPMTVRLPGGATANAHAEGASVGGFPSNRAMVTLKLPF